MGFLKKKKKRKGKIGPSAGKKGKKESPNLVSSWQKAGGTHVLKKKKKGEGK